MFKSISLMLSISLLSSCGNVQSLSTPNAEKNVTDALDSIATHKLSLRCKTNEPKTPTMAIFLSQPSLGQPANRAAVIISSPEHNSLFENMSWSVRGDDYVAEGNITADAGALFKLNKSTLRGKMNSMSSEIDVACTEVAPITAATQIELPPQLQIGFEGTCKDNLGGNFSMYYFLLPSQPEQITFVLATENSVISNVGFDAQTGVLTGKGLHGQFKEGNLGQFEISNATFQVSCDR